MSLSQMQDFTFKHSDQQDAIYTQYTAQQIKAFFDSRGDEIRTALNSLINTLNSSDGANNISATPIAVGSGATVQEQLAWLLSQIAIASTGSIPATSITEDKLALALLDKINKALSNTGVLTTLLTTDQSSLVNALNEHYVDDVNHVKYATATGTANTYTITLNPAPTDYVEGMAVSVKFNVDSTVASTLNVNGLGAKGIKKANGTDVTNLKANGIYTLRYDGVNFILQGEGGSGNAGSGDIRQGKTASTDTGDITGALVVQATSAQTITPGTVDIVKGAGIYDDAITVKGDADLIASNILNGKNIFGVVGNVIAGKRWATGTTTSSSVTESFQYASGTANSKYTLTVNGLDFKPSLIYAYVYDSGANYEQVSLYTEMAYYYPKTVKVFWASDNNSGGTHGNYRGDTGAASIINGSFKIPVYKASIGYIWIAIE